MKVIRLMLILLLAAPCFGSSSESKTRGSHSSKGKLEIMYERDVGYSVKRPPARYEVTEKTGITEVGLERTECFGICSVYTFILYSDGKAEFEGRQHIEPIGRYEAQIDPVIFFNLAQAALDVGYFQLEDNYAAVATDMPTVFTSVVKDGTRKIIRNYGNAGPPRLWLFEQALDDVRMQLEWKKIR